jgi:inner membrane protein
MAFTDTPTPGRAERTPGMKFLLTLGVGFLLTIPLFMVWLLVYDRQSQSETARASIVEGWGGAQTFAGPVLVIPYLTTKTETVEENGKQVTKTEKVWDELALSPETANVDSQISPETRKRSIYEAVIYQTSLAGKAHFVLPADLGRSGIERASLDLTRAELRFGVGDPRGLVGKPSHVSVGGKPLSLQPGHGVGATKGAGVFSWIDASALASAPLDVDFGFDFRGNASLTFVPRAGDTTWTVKSSWPNPSFQGGFLPTSRSVNAKGFSATYRVGNLALGQSLIDAQDVAPNATADASIAASSRYQGDNGGGTNAFARISLVQPVDLYDQVSRAAKYGFLFIGFTFLTFLMFDVIGGVRVSSIEYLLVGAGLILFFAMLLAFAEVVGFSLAYVVASAAIIGLITAYSTAVLKTKQRASLVGGLLTALYGVLYILLSLEAYSLLIGSLLLFAALAGVMYATRNLDWSAKRNAEVAAG